MWALDVPVAHGLWNLRGVLDRTLRYWPAGVTSLDISSSNIETLKNMPRLRELYCIHSKIQTLSLREGLRVLSCANTSIRDLEIPEGTRFLNVEGCKSLETLYAPDSLKYLNMDNSGIREVSVPDGLQVWSANGTGLQFSSLPFDLEELHAVGCGYVHFETLPLNLKVLKIDAVQHVYLTKWKPTRDCLIEIGGHVYQEPEEVQPLEPLEYPVTE